MYAGDQRTVYFLSDPGGFFGVTEMDGFQKEFREEIAGKSWVMRNIWNTRLCSRRRGAAGQVNNPVRLKSSGIKEAYARCSLVAGNKKATAQKKET